MNYCNKHVDNLAALAVKIELIGKSSQQMQHFYCHDSKI